MRVLAVSLFIGRRTCSPGRRRERRDLGDRPAIPEPGHPAERSLARAGASPNGVHPLERCPKFPSHPGMRSELSRSARVPWIKKPVENCFSQLRRSTISLLVGPRSRKPWRDLCGDLAIVQVVGPLGNQLRVGWRRHVRDQRPKWRECLGPGLQGGREGRARRTRHRRLGSFPLLRPMATRAPRVQPVRIEPRGSSGGAQRRRA